MSQSDRGLKAFHPIPSCKVSSEDETLTNSYLCNLMNEKVTMLTYSDLDHMWFTLRKFSLTSSSTCEALKRAAPYLSSDETIRAEFEEVLGYAGLKQYLTDGNDNEDDVDANEAEESQQINGRLVKEVVKLMRSSPTQSTVNDCAKRVKPICTNGGQLSPSTMVSMLVVLGVSRDNALRMNDNQMKSKLKKWANSIRKLSRDVSDSDSDLESEPSTVEVMFTTWEPLMA